MLDTHRIKTRINEIRNRVMLLDKHFKGIPENEFVSNIRLNAEAEHHLQIAIQACIDIANYLVAALGLTRQFKETGEVFDVLAEENIIPQEFAQVMRKKIVSYRNILVHQYLEVNRHVTYDNIQHHLTDLSQFAKYIEEFLEKQEKK